VSRAGRRGRPLSRAPRRTRGDERDGRVGSRREPRLPVRAGLLRLLRALQRPHEGAHLGAPRRAARRARAPADRDDGLERVDGARDHAARVVAVRLARARRGARAPAAGPLHGALGPDDRRDPRHDDARLHVRGREHPARDAAHARRRARARAHRRSAHRAQGALVLVRGARRERARARRGLRRRRRERDPVLVRGRTSRSTSRATSSASS
jgi:hypothetical protein